MKNINYSRRKIKLLIFIFLLSTSQSFAQNSDRNTTELATLAKIWGFLKYYHPNIASGKYNWDSELLNLLPNYLKITSTKERSDSLEAWINKFGEIPKCATCNDSLLLNAKLKPDFTWFQQSGFSESLVAKLNFIKNNRIQDAPYYIKYCSNDGMNMLLSNHEKTLRPFDYISRDNILLSVFRFWNFIEYWYPYKYNLPVSWNAILNKFIEKSTNIKNDRDYILAMEEMIASIHDSHGFFRSAKTEEVTGKYYIPVTVRLVENKLFITSILNDSLAKVSNIMVGDIIESIDAVPVDELIKKLNTIIPASNKKSFENKLSYFLNRTQNEHSNLKILRNTKTIDILTSNYIPPYYPPVDPLPPYFSFQKDSSFCILKDSIGYINVGNFKRNDSLALKEIVAKTKRLIIDLRQNQDEMNGTGGGDIIGNLILPPNPIVVKFSSPQPLYPGVFKMTEPLSMGIPGNPDYYKGQIILLINENTISVGEFITMIYQNAPQVKILGTPSAGADGNVTYISLPDGTLVSVSGLGVYYPDGRETQRVGIQPDILVKQTLSGYLHQKDEQLEKAIEYLSK